MNESNKVSVTEAIELETITKVLQGEIDHFEIIIRKYNEPFFRIGMSFLKNVTDVEDAMQSAYLKIFEKLSSFEGRSSFSFWACRVMVNECKLLLRQQQKRQKSLANWALGEAKPDLNSAEQELIAKEMKALFEKVILDLPEKYRQVYMIRMIVGLSVKETADCLEISVQNVKTRLHRAKTMLQEALYKLSHDHSLFEYHLIRCNKLTTRVLTILKQNNIV